MMAVSGVPVFYAVNLSNGALSGNIYISNLAASGQTAADLSYSETDSRVFILIKHNSGFHKIEYNPVSGTFTSSFTLSTHYGYFIKAKNGFSYIGGVLVSNLNNFYSKLIGNGENSQNQAFIMTASASSFTTTSSYGYSNQLSLTLLGSLLSSVTSTTFATGSPGTYTQSVANVYHSDVVYQGGFTATLYCQESYTGTISYTFPCSLAGSTSISSSIIAHPSTGTFPTWVSVNADNLNLNVVTPAGANTYYFGVRSVILGENVDEYVTLNVYQCGVTNCQSCSYATTNL